MMNAILWLGLVPAAAIIAAFNLIAYEQTF